MIHTHVSLGTLAYMHVAGWQEAPAQRGALLQTAALLAATGGQSHREAHNAARPHSQVAGALPAWRSDCAFFCSALFGVVRWQRECDCIVSVGAKEKDIERQGNR